MRRRFAVLPFLRKLSTYCTMRRRAPRPQPIKSPVSQRLHGVCVACGGRNVVRFGGHGALIQCRSCGVATPDFIQPGEPGGIKDVDQEPLDSDQANAMMDAMLDALSQDRTAKKLQKTLTKAHGDIALIYYHYIPMVIDVCALVVDRYGFVASVDGVKESVRHVQRLATIEADGLLTAKLIRLRRVLTPTGAWIKEDAEADADDQKRKREEQEQLRLKQREAERQQQLAEENAARARLRAKKIALGLDPSVPRLPLLVSSPPPMIATYADRAFHVRVDARYTQRFQWHLNGKPIVDDGVLYDGANRSTLCVSRLTRRTVGEYYCVCNNEEGAVSSGVTLVRAVAISSRSAGSRKLKALLPQGMVPFPSVGKLPLMVGMCSSAGVVLVRGQSLVPVKMLPPISVPHTATAIAWDPSTKLCAVASGSDRPSSQWAGELSLFSVDVAEASSKPPKQSPTKKTPSSTTVLPPPPSAVLTRHLATHPIQCTAKALHFLDNGRQLIVSDLHLVVQIFQLHPTAVCVRTLRFQLAHPISHIAATQQQPLPRAASFCGFAVCLRQRAEVELVQVGSSEESLRLAFPLAVHVAAFDPPGFYLAVAMSGGVKSKVCVRSIKETRAVPMAKQFAAHVGKITTIQWTLQSMLLATAGYDGYVKLWDLDAVEPTCVFSLHLDERGVHWFSIVDDHDVGSHPLLLAVGAGDRKLHARELAQLRAFEATRLRDMDSLASRIQKIWKGRHTRDLINQFIRPK